MGHAFDPRSREQLDNLIRLDGILDELMTFLDEEVGEDDWVMAFSSDHGVSDIPELLYEPMARLGVEDVREVLQTAQQVLVAGASSGDVSLRIAEALEPLPQIRRVFTLDEIERDQPTDSFVRLFANSYVPDRPVNQLTRFGAHAGGAGGHPGAGRSRRNSSDPEDALIAGPPRLR